MLDRYALVATLLTAVVTISTPSLETGESFVALVVLSLGLWDGLYVMASWLTAVLLSY